MYAEEQRSISPWCMLTIIENIFKLEYYGYGIIDGMFTPSCHVKTFKSSKKDNKLSAPIMMCTH